MKLTEIRLKHFRNLTDLIFKPDPKLNFLVGPNGQGKTSLIEAIGFLATLRSFRDRKAAHLVQWGQNSSEISCQLSSDPTESDSTHAWKTDLRIQFELLDPIKKKATKSAFINGKPYKSSTQYLSQRFGSVELGFHTVVFNPSDHDLVRGEPAVRRSYLDQVIAAQDVEYLKTLQKFQRALVQRNTLLKQKGPPYPTPALLSGFTEPFCAFGSVLAKRRLDWIEQINPILQEILSKIAPSQAPVRISYLSSWLPSFKVQKSEKLSLKNGELDSNHFTGQAGSGSLELLDRSLRTKLMALEAEERKVGFSLAGPHRDDWMFLLGDEALKGHGSQGEVRSALLALKLAEVVLFQKVTGHQPLFLLDDLSSELDQKRRSFLLQFLMETDLQTFVTTTDDPSKVGTRFWVSSGKIEEGRNDDRT
jgi:DNA replication and repair protein RecF